MYVQVVHYVGLDCEKCGRILIAHNRTTITQAVDANGSAVDLPGGDTSGSRSGRLVMRCDGCGAKTPLNLDGFNRRTERQANAPRVVSPCYLELPSA